MTLSICITRNTSKKADETACKSQKDTTNLLMPGARDYRWRYRIVHLRLRKAEVKLF